MTKAEENSNYDRILQYSRSYLLKKKKNPLEKQLIEGEEIHGRYVIYARKSTEDEKRQTQSIPDQIDLCKKHAKDRGLMVVDIVQEEKSAKLANNRPVFNEVLKTISNKGHYDSILAWHPDRLARNMKESGEILDLLDNGLLKDLKFVSVEFNNDVAGKMTLSILFAMAKEFSDKLSVDTKRGVKRKVSEGKYCGSYKRGYTTNNSEHFIPDNEKFPIYKEIWKLAINGESFQRIKQKFPLEKIPREYLKDPFPAGIYCYGSEVINMKDVDPNFQPLITISEFLYVQTLTNNKGGWTQTEDFLPFRDFVRCNYCNNYMTPGRSKSKSGERYLYLACGNSNCISDLKTKGIKPNRIRGRFIIDQLVKVLGSYSEVSQKIYEGVIKSYKSRTSEDFKEIEEEINVQRREISKLKTREEKYIDIQNLKEINESIRSTIIDIQKQKGERELKVQTLQNTLEDVKTKLSLETPPYNEFLNFFENIIPALQKTESPELLDNLIKMLFVNTVVGEKKVLRYTFNEPFKSYWNMKKSSGVDDGN